MKNHIAIKFLAILLAALSLLTAVGSAVGILVLTTAGLYDRTVAQMREEEMEAVRRDYAVNLVHRYASLNLGNLPEQYLDDYYGFLWQYDTFEMGRFCYAIRDAHGVIVESTLEEDLRGAQRYEISVTDVTYRRLLPEDAEVLTPREEGEEQTGDAITTEAVSQAESHRDSYYDYEQNTYVEFEYEYAKLPPYTVELYLFPGAVGDEYKWTLLETVWNYRNSLFVTLAGGLLIFSVAAVYLCCAAGRKPGSEEVRAGGLNVIPLDMYALGGGGAVLGAMYATVAVLPHLGENSTVQIYFAFLAALFCCLVFVGFCFACAAQFKTPGGFWWRNSLVGWSLRVLIWLWNQFAEGCVRLGAVVPVCIAGLGRLLKQMAVGIFDPIRRSCRWLAEKTARVYGMLPMIWQWLVAGGVMLALMLMGIFAQEAWSFLLFTAAAVGLLVYWAYSFGKLYEGAKQMRQGDLESKIHDQVLLGCFRDFSGELNGLADVAMTAAQDKLKSERMKTELITNVSHDIKTPLTSIINYVDLMEKPHTAEEQNAYLEVLSRQSQRLKKLIDDLMEMSKASTGNLSVEITEVDAAEAINQALGEFGDKLERAELTPVVRTPEHPVMMKADGKLLWRVLSNLLNNAVKYALPGTRLYIDLMEVEGKVVISLKNISREELNVSAEELMERFVRGDTSRNTEGSGLGLNIAQSLMEVQKGQLQLLVDGDLFKVALTFPGA